jgi:hypothetical protein
MTITDNLTQFPKLEQYIQELRETVIEAKGNWPFEAHPVGFLLYDVLRVLDQPEEKILELLGEELIRTIDEPIPFHLPTPASQPLKQDTCCTTLPPPAT